MSMSSGTPAPARASSRAGRPRARRLPTLGMFVCVTLCVLLCWRLLRGLPQSPQLPAAGVPIRVVRVIDGDTLLLEGGVRVRLLGVNTPETKHPDLPPQPFGEAASALTRSLVEGQQVFLEYDKERLDDYQRVLAFVWREGQCLNEQIIRAGFSPAVAGFPFRSDMQRRFREAQQAAQAEGLGIWSTRQKPSDRPQAE